MSSRKAFLGLVHTKAGSSAAGKAERPNETVDMLEKAFCLATGRLTMTAATDMQMQNGGAKFCKQ